MSAHAPATPGPLVARDPLLGTVVGGARLDAVLGEGAAARVYLATRLEDGRPYAVKVLSASGRPGMLERFRREARALRWICHPHVVAVYDSGTTADGRPFLMMEQLTGRTLASVIESEGRLLGRRLAVIARQILSGLAAAHALGLVHRDLKPANLMLVTGPDGERVKILDFGVVKQLEPVRGAITRLTKSEVLLGTPRYMSPEQILNPNQAGPGADLYALGVILYEGLSGRAPFEGSLIELIEKQLHGLPPPLATRTGLEPLVLGLLAKDPALRPQSAEEVMRRLRTIEVVDGEPDAPSILSRALGKGGRQLRRTPGVVLRRNEQPHDDRTLREDELSLGSTSLELIPPTPPPRLALPPTAVDEAGLCTVHDAPNEGPPTLLDAEAEAALTFAENTEDDGTLLDALDAPSLGSDPGPTRIVEPPRTPLPRMLLPPPTPTPTPALVQRVGARAKTRAPRSHVQLWLGLAVLLCFLLSALAGYTLRMRAQQSQVSSEQAHG